MGCYMPEGAPARGHGLFRANSYSLTNIITEDFRPLQGGGYNSRLHQSVLDS